MFLHDLDTACDVVLTEHEPPLCVGGVKGADSNVSLLERLQEGGQRHGSVL